MLAHQAGLAAPGSDAFDTERLVGNDGQCQRCSQDLAAAFPGGTIESIWSKLVGCSSQRLSPLCVENQTQQVCRMSAVGRLCRRHSAFELGLWTGSAGE